ncbi:uncharacterized protein LOC134751281 [Cydia strobilella]|uniref:uncharacterized protein LOC134751281 n=1 Tax=Cydia strobilella TaxID=1100964 RepID=UPI0030070C9E
MRVRSSLNCSLAPTMLPLLLLFSTASAEAPKILQKPIDHCPSIGYFFERQDLHNYPGTCYLCYCNNDSQAVCTIRDSERCEHNESSVDRTDLRDFTNVEEHGERTENNERRRSRRGLMELFFEDAKKDVMLKSMTQASGEECKPKSSKSIGCPPRDWCTGCLVCDCDDNGEWKCHVMSFCEDKTPRPKARKNKKLEINEIDTAETDERKDTTMKTIPKKKNDKRSVKHKKNKKTPKPQTSSTSTTTNKPQMQKIAVKTLTLKKFMRKDQIKNNTPVVVIKKYISTISPIDSPDLLKYKNDPQKLAQILYQQYEAATKTPRDSHAVKREIKLEKILNNKQKRHFELKYNARGRKTMNIKEHNDWNIKMRSRKIERDHMKTFTNTNSFYSKQNELLSPDEKIRLKKTQNFNKHNDKGSHMKKATVILIPRMRRNKRNVLPLIEVPTNSTIMENDTVNISVVNGDQVEALTSVLGINENISSDLNNYKYTVDNIVTKKYDDEVTNSGIVNESTIKYVDIITNNYHDLDTGNITATATPNYTNIEVETTTQQINYDLQSVDLSNYTINEISTQDNQLHLENNHTLETTTSIGYSSDKNVSTDKKFIINYTNLETTTVIKKNREINNSDNKINKNTNSTENMIKKGYITDIDKIIKDLNKYTLEKWNKTNKTNELIANMYTVKPNTSISRTFKSSTADFDKMLQNISHNRTKNNSKQNRMVAVQYLKKLYSQLLSTKNNKLQLNSIAVMESICDTFGPCKISTNKMELLNNKITELISETKKALNVIRIIKGILQSIDDEANSTDKHINDEVEFKSYVKKLNAVLTDSYKNPLTETELTQMNFIKNNTKIFINSIGKFAFILNDILEIIHSERIKFNNLRKRKILIKRVTRHKVSEPLHKIKNLFLKFNVLQNSFMRNMYQAISDLEKQNEQNAMLYDKSVNYQRDTRYKKSLDRYMNKINYNLEKLKVLALKVGAKGRKKRDLMDHDDAVEYLLTLMEYLLKHNNPVDSPQVADGIDLLIDAIRRAPDIRPIKKTNLTQTSLMPTFPKVKSTTKTSSESEDDNSRNKSSKEDFINDLSYEKQYSNDTRIVTPNNVEPNEYRRKTTKLSQKSASASITTLTTTKYVDVEDMAFNGDEVPKVYMATVPTYENIDDSDSEKEEKKPTIHKSEIKTNESANVEEEPSIMTNRTVLDTDDKKENNTTVTEKPIMTQFDRLNEEYEKQIKGKAPSPKNLKSKRKKNKRPRKKTKVDNKSDVSSITKEVDEEKTRKKVIVEEALLRKHIATSTEDDPFQIDDESLSRDVTHFNSMHNEVFPSYFT